MKDELKLVFPTEEYKTQVEELLQEHIDNNELVMHGAGGLDRLKDFDKWLEKVRNDLAEQSPESGRVPATLFLAVRKSDNKVIGLIQIRHRLNEHLLNNGGHIGDGVRPSERCKGYATEMIRLALEECRKLGIPRVLMTCDKGNIGSSKSIKNNGGVLENEIITEDGEILQRYWISLKKRPADWTVRRDNLIEVHQKIKTFNEKDFAGDICFSNFIKVSTPNILKSGVCIQNDNYRWIELYDYNSRIKLTAMYNEKNEIIEWYFDIARGIGKENGIAYEDDMYLDVVLTSEGKIIMLDEDEFEEAFERYEMTKEEYDEAYALANSLIKRLEGNKEKVKEFTDKYLEIFLKEE